jgi:hypothetical protein
LGQTYRFYSIWADDKGTINWTTYKQQKFIVCSSEGWDSKALHSERPTLGFTEGSVAALHGNHSPEPPPLNTSVLGINFKKVNFVGTYPDHSTALVVYLRK